MSDKKNSIFGESTNFLLSNFFKIRNGNQNPEVIEESKMLSTTTACASNADTSADFDFDNEILNHKVLKNDLILECIFGFLSFEDLRRFRCVCRQWNRVAIPFFRKLCLISFSPPDFSLRRFNRVFEDSDLGRDFTAMKLTYYNPNPPGPDEDYEYQWEEGDVKYLLNCYKGDLTELNLDMIKFEGDGHMNSGDKDIDLDPHIEPNSLNKLFITNVKRMIISTDHCASTKFLNLTECRLKISSGIKISPIELTMKFVNFRLNGNPQASWLNEFVNFERLKSINLENLSYIDHNNDDIGNLSMHFRDTVTVNRVDLCGRDLDLDFENGKWKITEKFSLRGADFVEPNEMEFSNFDFGRGVIELAVLPRNLKILKLEDSYRDDYILYSDHIWLPELEILYVHFNLPYYARREKKIGCISYFNSCQNLTTLAITLDSRLRDYPSGIDIATFPESIRKIYISGSIGFYGIAAARGFKVKQLHVKSTGPKYLKTILDIFNGEELAVDLRSYRGTFPYDSVLQTVVEISQKPFDKIAVAFSNPKKEETYKASPLFEITNELSGYYIFTNGFGTAISESKFENFFECWEKICETQKL